MRYMDRALELAENAIRNVSPNPPVGAVVVSNGKVVGEGWTQPPGKNHAEIVALNQAKQLAKASILYITLKDMGEGCICTIISFVGIYI